MENREEFLTEIVRRVQKNLMRMTEIERLTKELSDTLSRSDQQSMEILLRMRKDELDGIFSTREEIRMLVQAMDPEGKREVEALFSGEGRPDPEDFLAKRIMDLNRQMLQIRERTVAIDKRVSTKLAGENSYYQNQ